MPSRSTRTRHTRAGSTASFALALLLPGLLSACNRSDDDTEATSAESAASSTRFETGEQARSVLRIQPAGGVLFDDRPFPACTLERCDALPLDATAPLDITAEPETLARSAIQFAQRLRTTRRGAIGLCALPEPTARCDRLLELDFPSQNAPDLLLIEIGAGAVARHGRDVLGSCTHDDDCMALTKILEQLEPGRNLGLLVVPTIAWEDFARVVAAIPDDRTIELLPASVDDDSQPRPEKRSN
jgi:hypothetical protein